MKMTKLRALILLFAASIAVTDSAGAAAAPSPAHRRARPSPFGANRFGYAARPRPRGERDVHEEAGTRVRVGGARYDPAAFAAFSPRSRANGGTRLGARDVARLGRVPIAAKAAASRRHQSSLLLAESNPSDKRIGPNDDDEPGISIDIDATNDNEEDGSLLRSRSRDEWIDGRQMMQILAREEEEERRRAEAEEFRRQFARGQSLVDGIDASGIRPPPSREFDPDRMVSRISYTDANTLQIEIPPSGVDGSAVATGAFSALWFSAVAPATVSMLAAGAAGGALFMVPFWLAGGVVAKNAAYDPFVSSSLSVGKFLWTVERRYLGASRGRKEGPTESIRGADVELAVVINGVPRYQMRLFLEGGNSVTFGKGLDAEELQHLSRVINDHCSALKEEDA